MPSMLGWFKRDYRLFLFALLVQRIATIALHGLHGPGHEWAVIANNLVAGKGFLFPFYGTDVPRYAFFPPFYPCYLALCKLLGGVHWVGFAQTIQGVLFAIGTVWTRRLAARAIHADLSWPAGYVMAIWPPVLVFSTRLTPACFNVALIPGALLLTSIAIQAPRFWRIARAGAVYGILAYSLPSFQGSILFLPFVLRRLGYGWRRAILFAACALVAAQVIISPWTIRNAVMFGRYVPVATNFGFNVYGSNNEFVQGNYNVLTSNTTTAVQAKLIDSHELATMNEVDFDRKLLRQGVGYMVRHPLQTARRDLTRAFLLWWTDPAMVRYNRLDGLGSLIFMSLLLPFVAAGIWASRKLPHGPAWHMIYATLLWETVLYMNFGYRGRYGLELQPMLVIIGVLGAQSAVHAFRPARSGA